jgi:hypothetical protein
VPFGRAQSTPDQKSATTQTTQTSPAESTQTGPTAFVQAEGANFNMGTVTTYDFDIGYQASAHLSADIGVPLFAVRTPFSIVDNHDWRYTTILGTPYLDLRYDTKYDKTNITAILTGAFGLGEEKVYSTGRTAAQLFFHFDRNYQVLNYDVTFTPFLNIDAGTGTVDRQVFPRPYELGRPYETLGQIGTGEAGGAFTFHKYYRLEGSAYGLSPWGPQKIYSRFVSPDSLLGGDGHHNRYWDEFFITGGDLFYKPGGGPTRLDRDNGYGMYLTISKFPFSLLRNVTNFDVQLGYTRSVHYDYGAAFIMLRYNLSHILRSLTVGE